jgi:uncharacterized protein YjbJ (UPF0337 family)
MLPTRIVRRVPEVTCRHRRSPATLQRLSRYAVLPAPRGIRTCTQREESTMNWSRIESGWKQYKVDAKTQWSRLSNQQIESTLGKREQLAISVQQAYALSKEEAERQISAWQSRQGKKPASTG